ncbi:MAG: hypothetical protein E6772_18135, partial [Dysgonomonas sp.]|nr:hypothetical protein [Dysgonomonas sp.]
VGSMTEHGGAVVEGVPGVTISGGFPVRADNPEKLEPRIFNLRWMKGKHLIQSDFLNEDVIFRASTVGFEDGEKVDLKLYNDEGELIVETAVNVKDGEIELAFTVEDGHFKQKEDDEQE